jgi:hypothetical protein
LQVQNGNLPPAPAFLATLPDSAFKALLRASMVQLYSLEGIHYKLAISEYLGPVTAQARRLATYVWAHYIIPPATTDQPDAIMRTIVDAFSSIQCRTTDVKPRMDAAGFPINSWHIDFEISDMSTIALKLPQIRVVTLPSQSQITLKLSAQLCTKLGIHQKCLKPTASCTCATEHVRLGSKRAYRQAFRTAVIEDNTP